MTNSYIVRTTLGLHKTVKAQKGGCDNDSLICVDGVCFHPSVFAGVVDALVRDGYLKITSRQMARVVYENVPTVVDPFSREG